MNTTNNNCAWCGSCEGCEQNSPAYKVCAKCKAVFYCSRECQINDCKKEDTRITVILYIIIILI